MCVKTFKFLLTAINAKYIHSNPAVYSLKAFAGKELGRHVEIAEYTINQLTEDILADIYIRRPDVIGLSCYIWNRRITEELLGELPKILPGVKLWLGGPEASWDAPAILERFPQITGIMVGEGEVTFRELLQYYVGEAGQERPEPEGSGSLRAQEGSRSGELRTAKELENIAGLCLPAGYTAERGLTCLDAIPFPYGESDCFENRIVYYESSRGCPYRCSYCLSSIDKQVRLRDINVIKEELKFFLDRRVPQVKFVDRTFNCVHEHAMAVWQFLNKNDNGVTNFHFEISADLLTEEELELLRKLRPGLVQLEIGVQSTNPKTLAAIRRAADLDKLEKAVRAVRSGRNIHQHLDLIAGLPYEDYESFGRSFNRVYAMRPQQLQMGFLKLLKGSELCARSEEFGIVYRSGPPYEVLSTKWLSYGDVLRLKKTERMVERYYNSGQFKTVLPYLERAFPSPFAMFEALGDFYEQKGYFRNSPARTYYYEALLEFAGIYDGSRLSVYRELLIYDLYLRENLKNRPSFAPDISGTRSLIRDFYQREAKERKFLPGYRNYDARQMAGMTHMEPFRYRVWDPGCASEGGGGRQSALPIPDRQASVNDYERPDAAREVKAERQNAGGEKAEGEKAGGEKAEGEKAGGEKAGGEKAGGEKAEGEKVEAEYFVLFDYRSRSPLDDSAAVRIFRYSEEAGMTEA